MKTPLTSSDRNRAKLILVWLALAALACSPLGFFGGDSGQQAADRAATLEVELANASGTATAAALAEPADQGEEPAADQTADGQGPALSQQVELDFSADNGAFALGQAARVEDGALLLGPYESCANDVANFDAPVDCLVVCRACGQQLGQYRMAFDFTFEDGLTDREFGAILRFVDVNGDGLIDRPDYLLALAFNIYDNRWRLYLHEPDKIEPWRQLAEGQAGFLRAGRLNHVEIQTIEDGRQMEVFLNDGRILLLTGDEPYPGERLVDPWVESGAVGFLGLGRGVTARFDNFVLEAEG